MLLSRPNQKCVPTPGTVALCADDCGPDLSVGGASRAPEQRGEGSGRRHLCSTCSQLGVDFGGWGSVCPFVAR